MEMQEIIDLALECGFSHAGPMDTSTLVFRDEVRAMCAADKCNAYGKNWACPPGCGTVEECAEMVRKYKRGVIVQTTGELEDSMDFEAFSEIAAQQKAHFHKFSKALRERLSGILVVGDSHCDRCKKCTYPDAPCRFPEERSSSMEALGLVVSEVCQKNNIPYYYGPGTLTYVGMVLID